jgi:hypothetical protein
MESFHLISQELLKQFGDKFQNICFSLSSNGVSRDMLDLEEEATFH